ncbi:MAG: photosynthetic complex putative assembly protein PuhB [Pseudomonadota bacterium]
MSRTADLLAAQDDFDIEPIPGLPEKLPEGEHILWSGEPDWRAIALDVFHLRAIAIYAAVIITWRFTTNLYDGGGIFEALVGTGIVAAVLGTGLAILTVLALATAKSARYTITNKRVVMRIGVALTLTINLPFKQILSANYRTMTFGTGGIALQMAESGGLGYVVLWPHVRPFKLSNPEPMLRGIKDGERVARILATALTASHSEEAPQIHIKAPARRADPVAA